MTFVRSICLSLLSFLLFGAAGVALAQKGPQPQPQATAPADLVGGMWRGTMYWQGQELPIDWEFFANGTARDGAGLSGAWSATGNRFRLRFSRSANDYADYNGTFDGATLTASFTYNGTSGTVRATREGGGSQFGSVVGGRWHSSFTPGFWTEFYSDGTFIDSRSEGGRYTQTGNRVRLVYDADGNVYDGVMVGRSTMRMSQEIDPSYSSTWTRR